MEIVNSKNCRLCFVCFVQNVSGKTFKSIFEGKQSRLEEKINVDEALLGKLEEYGIITELQRSKIEVICLLFASFIWIINRNLQFSVAWMCMQNGDNRIPKQALIWFSSVIFIVA